MRHTVAEQHRRLAAGAAARHHIQRLSCGHVAIGNARSGFHVSIEYGGGVAAGCRRVRCLPTHIAHHTFDSLFRACRFNASRASPCIFTSDTPVARGQSCVDLSRWLDAAPTMLSYNTPLNKIVDVCHALRLRHVTATTRSFVQRAIFFCSAEVVSLFKTTAAV